jgi:hypothetical protein
VSIDVPAIFRSGIAAARDLLSEIVRTVVREELGSFSGHDPEELLDAHQAAKLLGTTPGALRRACERGRGPAQPVRIGRRLRWRRRDLVQLGHHDR